jgi:hypothetical protein
MNLRSPGGTKILGALALLVVAAIGWVLALGPQTSAITDVRTQTADATSQNDVLRQQLAVLRTQEEQLPRSRAAARDLSESFPATADQPGLFQAVAEAVSDAGIDADKLTALTPTPPVVGGVDPAAGVALPTETPTTGLATQLVTVTVEATYGQTSQLLANLEQMPRAYLITAISVASAAEIESGTGGTGGAGDGVQFSTTITGDMFVMPMVQEIDAEADESPS